MSRYRRLAAAVRALYRRLDRRTSSFRRASGLSCPPGCGECCLSAEVEATELELLPLALHLQREGSLTGLLERLREGEGGGVCVFHSREPLGRFGGRCTVYSWRPLVCRLFGFASAAGAGGRPELAVCRAMRSADPTAARAAAEAAGRLTPPVMRAWSLAVYRLDPVLGSSPLPVNDALRQALERVALEQGLRGRPGRKRADAQGRPAATAARP